MPTETLISVEEYLATSYRPDVDYIDGRIEERNLGEWDHGNLQMRISAYLFSRRKQWGISVAPEVRVQVGPARFRVPDITVVLGEPDEQVLTKPPFLCIEILSPEDRMSRVEQRIDDYLQMGVPYVWLLEPQMRRVYIATKADGLREFKGEVLRTENPALEVPLSEIFE
ncbi:MAG TPA: Uma2 family endonuclease [Bryobacteraceae bacterium]|jgi:Uma2 family endonuclease|nr:Uma2 family endonuclease [Bryobacteraceae bacterium]